MEIILHFRTKDGKMEYSQTQPWNPDFINWSEEKQIECIRSLNPPKDMEIIAFSVPVETYQRIAL